MFTRFPRGGCGGPSPPPPAETVRLGRIRRASVAVAIAASLGAFAVEAQGAAGEREGKRLTGNLAGVALLRRVETRYRTVPGVRGTVAAPGFRAIALLSLRLGVVDAQEVRWKAGSSDLVSVARRGQPSHAYNPLKRCWQTFPRGGGVTFDAAVGSHFPTLGLTRLQAPRRVPAGWAVGATWKATGAATGRKVVLVIDTPSYLLHSLTMDASGKRLTERFSALATHPQILTPRRFC